MWNWEQETLEAVALLHQLNKPTVLELLKALDAERKKAIDALTYADLDKVGVIQGEKRMLDSVIQLFSHGPLLLADITQKDGIT